MIWAIDLIDLICRHGAWVSWSSRLYGLSGLKRITIFLCLSRGHCKKVCTGGTNYLWTITLLSKKKSVFICSLICSCGFSSVDSIKTLVYSIVCLFNCEVFDTILAHIFCMCKRSIKIKFPENIFIQQS